MSTDPNLTPLVIFGCGYVGTRLARTALAQGRTVRACSRGIARLEPLRELGAQLHYIDASRVKQFGPALQGVAGATVVYSIPPVPNVPAGESVRRASQAALQHGVRSFIYLGSAGVYGNTADPDWADEESTVALDDGQMSSRHTDEAAVQSASSAGLRTAILRLAAIYGPGRGVRQRLRKGDYKLIDGGANYISRIHVDDLVRAIFAVEEKAPPGALYLVGDDLPTTQKEYADWLCERLGVPLPRSVPAYGPGVPRTFQRGRRLRNDRLKRELTFTLLYPSFREGEAQIEAEEAGVAAAIPFPIAPIPVGDAAAPVAAVAHLAVPVGGAAVPVGGAAFPVGDAAVPVGGAAAPVAAVPPPVAAPRFTPSAAAVLERPGSIRHVSTLGSYQAHYEGSDEILGTRTPLAKPLGLSRVGVNLQSLAPGHRTSWPHAHSTEEELVFVVEGEPDVWLDGRLHHLRPGDVVGFPAGTGVAHTFINNSSTEAKLFVVGENRSDDRLAYPLHPAQEASLDEKARWSDAPRATLGPHDAEPDQRRR